MLYWEVSDVSEASGKLRSTSANMCYTFHPVCGCTSASQVHVIGRLHHRIVLTLLSLRKPYQLRVNSLYCNCCNAAIWTREICNSCRNIATQLLLHHIAVHD